MKTISLGDINLLDVGHTIQMSGVIWAGDGKAFITLLPHKVEELTDLSLLPMELPEWEKFLRQTDLLETEILSQDPTGKLVKTIVRKTQRQIDSYLQWAVFQRDNYHCRYCGRTGIPLTVDHIDLWEEGGAAIAGNLLSACRQCNKDRGNMHYEDWIVSPIYLKKSRNLSEEIKQLNLSIVQDLPHLKSLRVLHVRSR